MREKLIELLSGNISEFVKLSVIRGTTKITGITFDADRFADRLIVNGVTIPVRCKDCKHYEETTGKDSGKPCGYGKCVNRLTMLMAITYDEDFCSYGERKTDAETD